MKVLLIGTFASAGRPLLERFLQTECEIISFPGPFDEQRILGEIATADVVVGAPFTRAMGLSATNLRLIHNTGVGTDRYDVASFPANVRLCVSYHHEAGMAEYVIMMVLALTRRVIRFDAQLRQGQWDGSCIFGPQHTAREIAGTTLGLIGYGRIGREVAKRASALAMRVRAIKRSRTILEAETGIDFIGGPQDLPGVLAAADYLVITCPLTAETEGLIGEKQFDLMKPDSYLINVARGKIVEERALYEALRTSRIAGAALDVWYNYPPSTVPSTCYPSAYPFHELNNVIMTPHVSSCTVEAVEARWRDIAYNLEHLETGSTLRNEVFFRR
jgi:phosphoglycerate dehydrogenase-like enzyme